MNRQEIRDEIRRLVQDTDTDVTRQKWSDDVLNARIDLAHEKIASLARCITARITSDTVAGTQEYDLPDFFLNETSVMYLDSSGVYVPLTKKTEKELDLENAYWRNDSGTPSIYYIRRNRIGLVPCPNVSTTNGVRLDVVRKIYSTTTAASLVMDEDTDIPFDSLPALYPYHEIICYEVARVCKLDEKEYDRVDKLEAKVLELVRQIKYQVLEENQETRIPNIYESVRSNHRRTR